MAQESSFTFGFRFQNEDEDSLDIGIEFPAGNGNGPISLTFAEFTDKGRTIISTDLTPMDFRRLVAILTQARNNLT